jgi:hypothetical protein
VQGRESRQEVRYGVKSDGLDGYSILNSRQEGQTYCGGLRQRNAGRNPVWLEHTNRNTDRYGDTLYEFCRRTANSLLFEPIRTNWPQELSHVPDLRLGGTYCSSTPMACAVTGYIRGGQRPHAGMKDPYEPTPTSKETARALECGTCTRQRPCQKMARARMRKNSTRDCIKETVCTGECLQNPACD